MTISSEEPGVQPQGGVQSTSAEVPAVAYEDPKAGGSYLRDPETGDLVRLEPNQPEQPQE